MQRSRTEDEHENMRAGLRIQHCGVACSIERDKALKNGGFAAAREGVGDMDWGVRHGHRGQNAPLLLVNDAQSGRQGLSEAVVEYAAQGVPGDPVATVACQTQGGADRATH